MLYRCSESVARSHVLSVKRYVIIDLKYLFVLFISGRIFFFSCSARISQVNFSEIAGNDKTHLCTTHYTHIIANVFDHAVLIMYESYLSPLKNDIAFPE